MSSGIEIEGLEEFEKTIQDMTITDLEAKAAIRAAIKPIADTIEKETPKGETGRLKKLSKTVKTNGLGYEGIVRAKAFYDIFQEFGTSQQKSHVGYFDRAVKSSEDEAINILSNALLNKVK